MKKAITLIIITVFLMSCTQKKINFDEVALNEIFKTLENKDILFKDILAKHKGKTIFIDVWASWCHDCLASIPKLKELQKQETDIVYVMLSVDKVFEDWKIGIEKHQLNANHYFIPKGMKKSDFAKSINLDWIPRYIIVGKDGTIKLHRAIEFSDKKIKQVISEDR